MKLVKMSLIAALTCGAFVAASADDAKPKRELKGNMMEVYNVLPGTANSITEAFTDGVFYGRLRMNAFKWDWKDVDSDNKAFGIGGSMIYKTAAYEGLSATAGLYYSDSPFESLRQDEADIGDTKAGKDTFSRYNVFTTGDWSMASLAQAYLQYDISKTSVRVGRQIFESFLTKSNDTRMIPNTFNGLVVANKDLPQTRIRGAYFLTQKLRDHTTFHDPLTYDDRDTANKSQWNGNDDSAVHKGLSFTNFKAAGEDTEHDLIVVDLQNKSIENLQVDVTYGGVPGVISSLTGELNYKVDLGDGYSLTPGVRYMKQFDNGGGEIGGACLKGGLAGQTGNVDGYKDAASLDSSLAMARLVLKKGPLKAQIAYSAVEDAADIVAPWRGFPTGGYTRAMAQYNWYANTKTTAAEVKYDFSKAKMVPGLTAMVRYAMQDFDEAKQTAGVQADSNILHVDLIEKFTPDLYAKVRVGMVNADDRVGSTDKDSYNEYRFELNYLF
ncbi:OprD family outer membrane porin [Sulfurimonas microaerophilic]|uniref:OprD family outer membrane porin n=1 Tax=Sulfurimonas microaerophilic TaxID=3058392 RepID=UPI0027146A1F|nr:OprD family outer membrane porin [Sulfurimonas sp. hsl 1-7]